MPNNRSGTAGAVIKRHITARVLEALGDTPVVLLNGPRQAGKSTLAQEVASHEHPARYLTLDDATTLAAARNDPQGFLAGFVGPVVIDEIQRAPELFLAIKTQVDRDRRPGRFLLTGSADVLLLPNLAESLAGRMEILTLWPFSQGEIKKNQEDFIDSVFSRTIPRKQYPRLKWADMIQKILRGGYPEILGRQTESRQAAWFGSYITTILQRDVRDITHIEGLTALPRLFALLAARAASLVNFSEISRTSTIPQSTLKRYMTILEITFLLQTLPAWSGNLSKRLVKAPKLVIGDTGLMTYLLGLNEERLLHDPILAGHVLENFVIMELKKQLGWNRIKAQLFHFRTQTGQEVDIVLEDLSGQVVGIEVKSSASVAADDFKGLRLLHETIGKRFVRGIVLYAGSEFIPFGSELQAFPVSALWGGV